MKPYTSLLPLFFALLGISAVAAVPPPGTLALEEGSGVYTVQYGGKTGDVGIPSWKAVLRRDDAGNISALHVPADDPRPLSSRQGQWPITIFMTRNEAGVEGTISRGRENFAAFPCETFKLVEKSADKIVITAGGPSKNRHFEHQRVYTFTAAGVQIDGTVHALIDLVKVSFDPHWDRRQVADTHAMTFPMRTQGRVGWVYAPSSGSDGWAPLPAIVDYPLETEIRLRRAVPTYVRFFVDKNFESAGATGRRMFIYNDKDYYDPNDRKMLYERITGIAGGALPKGGRDAFKVRFEFETRDWP